MPRSGPRPYDCVRRAWHSERHQPVRGSLIKEIFRVVNEIHSSVTKKNKEWQEKLPIVVLKAEEIMYSKANSEAEYTDLKTLWDRTNDAINTIIRRDESAETGQFLQPCIEAALTLGCIPRRASRSQRNSNPSCYLNPTISNVHSVSPSVVENASQRDSTSNSQYRPHCSNLLKPKAINSNHLGFESRCPAVQSNDCTTLNLRVAAENVPPSGYPQSFPRENQAASNFSTTLYYGNFPLVEDLKHGFFMLPEPVSDPLEPGKMGVIPHLLHNGDESNKSTLGATSDYHENPCTVACDLSLRLGLLSSQSPIGETSQPQEVKTAGAQERTEYSDHSTHLDKRLSFFDKGNEYGGPRDSYPSRMNSEGEYTNVQAAIRKRKVTFDHQTDGIKFCRHPEPPFNHLIGSMRN